ncbi:hypothetical protein [Nocardia sp. NPDC057227]|uniref:hypothetical protein n=1 Tax=Nocardia sp. NPDC057227 TaxID=3346056 RepID=UPI0036395660
MALVVSLVSLFWNIGLTLIRWPRIGVVIKPTVSLHMGSPQTITDSYQLAVINQGAEAVTIANIGLRSADRSLFFDYDIASQGANPILPEGETLPARIEGHGCLVWRFEEDILSKFPHGTQIYGYADRYRTFRRWPVSRRDPVRRTKTVVASHRNGGQRAVDQ